jgi:acetyl-CoA synthetase (ADP-forming)
MRPLSPAPAAPPRIRIGGILEPRSVAVFGASDDRSKWAGRIMYYLALHGWAGDVVPINPRRTLVQGKTCYPRIGEAPAVDVAVIAIPAALVPGTLRECADAGVGCCLVISSGFAEVGSAGVELQREISELSRSTGMRLIGPNCLGLINVRNGMALTSARVLEVERLIPGGIGFVTQSGAVMLSVFNRAHDAGIGFSHLVSVGNQADLELCDFFEHMIDDPATRVICLHIEGLRDGQRFAELLGASRRAGKPVLVTKVGRSAPGERAARSHTASLAGSYAVFEAVCRDAGAVVTDDPDVMVLAARMIERFGPCPAGDVAMFSPSGGINGIVADRLADAGVRLATISPDTRTALGEIMLPTHVDNPVDLGARRQELGEGDAVAARAVEIVASDAAVGTLAIVLTTSTNYEATAKALSAAAIMTGKPSLTILTPGSVANGVRQILKDSGCPYCDRIDDGVRVLASYRAYAGGDALPRERRGVVTSRVPLDLRPGYVNEPDAKDVLAGYGIPVTRQRLARGRDEAIAAARAIGFPVALKGVTDKVVHKSDAGLVELALDDVDAVARAWDRVSGRLHALDPGHAVVVVQEMARGCLELIVGARRDPQFGPVVIVGAGGVLAELVRDVQIVLAPLGLDDAAAALRRLKIRPLLEGFRGRPPVDVAAIVDTLCRVGQLAVDLGHALGEIDVNPLIVRAAGDGVVAADARAVLL